MKNRYSCNVGFSDPIRCLERMKVRLGIVVALLFSLSAISQNHLTGYEYWFDDNYAERIASTLSPASTVELNSHVNTQSLSWGFMSIMFDSWMTAVDLVRF